MFLDVLFCSPGMVRLPVSRVLVPSLTGPLTVIITAMPYFLSRLKDSSLKSTFGSYLTTTFTLANFIFLAHATVTSKLVR